METCRLLFVVTVLMLSIAVSWRSVHTANIAVFFFFCMRGPEGIYRKGRNSRTGFVRAHVSGSSSFKHPPRLLTVDGISQTLEIGRILVLMAALGILTGDCYYWH